MTDTPDPVEQPPWLIAVKELIPPNTPHVIVYAERVVVDGEKTGMVAVASNVTMQFAKELLMLGYGQVAAQVGG
jgi:hypothetical protein